MGNGLKGSVSNEVAEIVETDSDVSDKIIVIIAAIPFLKALEAQGKLSESSRVLVPVMGNGDDFIVKQRHCQLPPQLHHHHHLALFQ